MNNINNKLGSNLKNKQADELSINSIQIKNIETKNNLCDKNIENEGKISLEDQKENSIIKNLYFTNKKRGRKNNRGNKSLENNVIHDKFSDDNIKRKVKTHFHSFIIAYLNKKSNNILGKKNKFGKIASYITQNITVEFNQRLFEQKIKDIIVKMSDKYQDKNKNSMILQYILDNKENNNDELINLLNMKYKDLFLNIYLKTNKDTFEGELEDESYETYVNKMEKIYGNKYVSKYKKNAETLISFFYKCKKRIRKKFHNKLINPLPFLNTYGKGNNPNNFYNGINYFQSNIMISTSTQTNTYISEDEEDYYQK
jgi:hypothetical protein